LSGRTPSSGANSREGAVGLAGGAESFSPQGEVLGERVYGEHAIT